jgi:hypothetical protein
VKQLHAASVVVGLHIHPGLHWWHADAQHLRLRQTAATAALVSTARRHVSTPKHDTIDTCSSVTSMLSDMSTLSISGQPCAAVSLRASSGSTLQRIAEKWCSQQRCNSRVPSSVAARNLHATRNIEWVGAEYVSRSLLSRPLRVVCVRRGR